MGYIDAHASFHVLQPSMHVPTLDLLLTTDLLPASCDLLCPGLTLEDLQGLRDLVFDALGMLVDWIPLRGPVWCGGV